MTDTDQVVMVAFLGTGRYTQVEYELDNGNRVTTCFMPVAAARFFGANAVRILATEKAQEIHGKELLDELSKHALSPDAVRFETIPDGGGEADLWTLFEVLHKVLAQPASRLVLDITHGFRAHPFFSAACISYLQALGHLPGELEVIYGAFEHSHNGARPAPVWRLTPFLQLVDFATGVGNLVNTGQADHLLKTIKQIDSQQRRERARQGQRAFPPTSKLAEAIKCFANDLATIRIPHLLRGYQQDMTRLDAARSSAQALLDAVDAFGKESSQAIPALEPVLECLRGFADGLSVNSLHGEPAQKAMRRLAELYCSLRRYPEAAVVVREALVSRHAESPAETEAGVRGLYSREARARAEQRWREIDANISRAVSGIRNDIEHGGFQVQPKKGETLRQEVEKLIQHLDAPDARSAPVRHGRTWFVSRHPGAIEWAKSQNIRVDRQVAHLDTNAVQAEDTVIGTLPINRIAELNEKGAHYLHLVIDIPPEFRGKELTADHLRQFNAHLQAYRAQRLDNSNIGMAKTRVKPDEQ